MAEKKAAEAAAAAAAAEAKKGKDSKKGKKKWKIHNLIYNLLLWNQIYIMS